MANHRSTTRRRRSRSRGSQRQPNNGILRKLLVMLAVVACVLLGVTIFFRVQTVDVQGNAIYSAKQVTEASGLQKGDNLLLINRASVAGKVKAQLPFVRDVSVGLLLPDTVVVKVEESQLVCQVSAGPGSQWFVNGEGRILGSSLEGFNGQIVELRGATVDNPKVGDAAQPAEGYESALNAALSIVRYMEGTGLIEKVTVVNVEKPYDIELLCGDQYQILLGGSDELEYKIQYLQVVLEGLDPYQAGTIDLTFDQDRVAVFSQWQ